MKFHSQFIHDGDLVFDIGANVGEMTALYLRLGARVVSVEPQEECVRKLQERFGNHPRAHIVPMAVGSTQGEHEMMLSDIRSPLSSMSKQWIDAVRSSGRFPRYKWSKSVSVPVVTLDSLIERFGRPAFCKIDVEGFETETIKGLSIPLESLSFEYHVELLEPAGECIDRLKRLGDYRFNYTIGRRTRWESSSWVSGEEIMCILRALPQKTLQGDVYARLLGALD
jgi:FkbM family methyltransferase